MAVETWARIPAATICFVFFCVFYLQAYKWAVLIFFKLQAYNWAGLCSGLLSGLFRAKRRRSQCFSFSVPFHSAAVLRQRQHGGGVARAVSDAPTHARDTEPSSIGDPDTSTHSNARARLNEARLGSVHPPLGPWPLATDTAAQGHVRRSVVLAAARRSDGDFTGRR